MNIYYRKLVRKTEFRVVIFLTLNSGDHYYLSERNSIRANQQIGHDGQVDVSRNFVYHQKTQRENANQNGLERFLPSIDQQFQKNQGKKG